MTNFRKAAIRGGVISLLLSSIALSANDDDDNDFRIQASETDARRALQMFASCTVDRNRTGARQLALMQPLDPEIKNISDSLVDKKCLDVRGQAMRLAFSPAAMRYAIAEALIHKEMKDYQPENFQTASGLDHGQAPKINNSRLPPNAEKRKAAILNYERRFQTWLADSLGECAARLAPSETRKLLDTRLGSSAEKDALAAMENQFAKCRPEGMVVTLDKFDTRGAVAVNYYRLATSTLPSAN